MILFLLSLSIYLALSLSPSLARRFAGVNAAHDPSPLLRATQNEAQHEKTRPEVGQDLPYPSSV